MSVYVSVCTAYSLAKSYGLDGLTAALLSLMAFLLAAAPQSENKMALDYLGGEGVFTALLCAILSVELIRLLKKYYITIRMPAQVPLVSAVLSYFALYLDLEQKMVAMAPWTAPAPLGAMISVAWNYRAAVLVVVLMILDVLIWYPFFKVYEKQLLAQERGQARDAGEATPQTAQ